MKPCMEFSTELVLYNISETELVGTVWCFVKQNPVYLRVNLHVCLVHRCWRRLRFGRPLPGTREATDTGAIKSSSAFSPQNTTR